MTTSKANTKTKKATADETAQKMADEAQQGFEAMADFFMTPKLDLSYLGDFHRKNVDATYQAGKILAEGSKSVLAKGVELGRDAVQEFADLATGISKAGKADSDNSAAAGMALLQESAQKNMAAVRELTGIAFEANQEAFAILQSRYSEGMAQMRSQAE